MNNEKIQPSKLDIILEKKQYLDATIQDCQIRIDEKLASLIDDGFISKEMNPELFDRNFQDSSLPIDNFLSGVDISDDDALDQAVLNSHPFENRSKRLAFDGDLLADKTSVLNAVFENKTKTIAAEDEDDEELPTLSKILGRTMPFADQLEEKPMELDKPTKPEVTVASVANQPDLGRDSHLSDSRTQKQATIEHPDITELFIEPEIKIPPDIKNENVAIPAVSKKNKTKMKKEAPVKNKEKPVKTAAINPAGKKPSLKAMIMPLVFFFFGLMAFVAFLILATPDFNFIDYSVVFILFTCLIFTIAMPYSASVFFMVLLLCSYVALSLISIFYLEVPFEFYQTGWIIVIPLILWSSALLIKKVRELFNYKKTLERQIASYDELEESPGLTIEKAYYKDLKYAMDRAAKGETILALEMITICHFDSLKSINGSRLWDEILYKTLKIIKMHCYSTHLIYILDGNVFSILMENTSVKNQLLINQEINDAFNAMILANEAIDVEVKLSFATVPYTRDITNPFDYRALVLRHLKS